MFTIDIAIGTATIDPPTIDPPTIDPLCNYTGVNCREIKGLVRQLTPDN